MHNSWVRSHIVYPSGTASNARSRTGITGWGWIGAGEIFVEVVGLPRVLTRLASHWLRVWEEGLTGIDRLVVTALAVQTLPPQRGHQYPSNAPNARTMRRGWKHRAGLGILGRQATL